MSMAYLQTGRAEKPTAIRQFVWSEPSVPDRYVLTGGPASGKTTLLRRLEGAGYRTVQEAPRTLADEHKGVPFSEVRRDLAKFERGVVRLQLAFEAAVPEDAVCIFDRGLPDTIPYLRLAGEDTGAVENLSRGRYRTVFFLEPLPIKFRPSRVENGRQEEFSQMALEAYLDLGYGVVRVPSMPTGQRMRMVMNHVKRG